LLPPEAVIGAVDEADGEALPEVVPTAAEVVLAGVETAVVAAVVPLTYKADDGATAAVDTGLTTVHGQLVMVKVVAEEAV